MPEKTNKTPQTTEQNTKNLSLKDLTSVDELTPELLEQIEQKDTGKVIQLLLETPEAKKLAKEIEKLQESCEKSGMKLEDRLIIGSKSLRELSDKQTDTANKDSLLKYAVLCVGMANQKKIPATFVSPTFSEDNVDMSKVSSFGKSQGILATLLELLSKFANIFQKTPKSVEQHQQRVDSLGLPSVKKHYLKQHAADYQNLKQELEKSKDTPPDKKLLEEIKTDVKTGFEKLASIKATREYNTYDDNDDAFIQKIFNAETNKKLLHAAPLLRNMTLEDLKNLPNKEDRLYLSLAKFQFDVLDNNIKCYEAVKNGQSNKIIESIDGLTFAHSWRKCILQNASQVLRFDNLFTSMERNIGIISCKHKKVDSPISTALLISDAAFKQELQPLSGPYRIVVTSLNKKAQQFCRAAIEEAVEKKMELNAPKKEEIQKKSPELLSGPMA